VLTALLGRHLLQLLEGRHLAPLGVRTRHPSRLASTACG
jgi:hypothetical protein